VSDNALVRSAIAAPARAWGYRKVRQLDQQIRQARVQVVAAKSRVAAVAST
jgi:hypothetical protein